MCTMGGMSTKFAANNVLLGMSADSSSFRDRASMNGFTTLTCIFPIAASVITKCGGHGAVRTRESNIGGESRLALFGLLLATGSLFLWSGCATTSKTRPAVPAALSPAKVPSKVMAVLPEPPVTVPQAPAVAVPPTVSQPVPAPGVVTVGSESMSTRLMMLLESEPAGATIVVDGRPVGKTPLQLSVPATPLGFFNGYLEIRARFIADSESEVSRTVTEEFSPREKVPAVLRFTPADSRRTVRSE